MLTRQEKKNKNQRHRHRHRLSVRTSRALSYRTVPYYYRALLFCPRPPPPSIVQQQHNTAATLVLHLSHCLFIPSISSHSIYCPTRPAWRVYSPFPAWYVAACPDFFDLVARSPTQILTFIAFFGCLVWVVRRPICILLTYLVSDLLSKSARLFETG
ncbi:hypothetical protein BGW36DRAFT_174025 [Talaromyces proteolyticus]|uniref:Uncharacterized protein n=1 Tax=Talaromyces proteolyticus TaxID=1131652 RepID=A0AAD4Q0M1_9EURO|nr:uncharacterized protein BGW36DRAFT_174025 [Talaromyces proteolyticus]KAH8697727.1 hypothetical protein BGW36DRAFT_174025 [Talaromyces proteolyticus]